MSLTDAELAQHHAPATLSEIRLAEAATAFHWPRFHVVLCGTQTDRERLGLPLQYQPDCLRDALPAAIAALRSAPVAELLQVLSDPQQALVQRYAAGQLLALLGDPRIVLLAPDMMDIPGGEVALGLPEAEVAQVMQHFDQLGLNPDWIRKECPRHAVRLAPYRLARFPVTQQEFMEFLQATGYPDLPASWSFRRYPIERSNHPVYGVSVQMCEMYAAWLSARTGRHFRLPTEAEWEFAAAGPEGLEFPWGAEFDADRANCCETGIFDTTPVGMFPGGVSPFGIHDLAGNVEEYVTDDYRPYPGGPAIDDHLSQIHGSYRIARGGSFGRFRDLARTRRRHGHNPRSATYAMGFRLAESP